jgi:hypothetical protein
MFIHNKTLPYSIWVQEFQIACGLYEKELKKTAPCGFGSPVEVYGVIEKVTLATTKEVFVKLYLSNSKDRSLVEYAILCNVTSYAHYSWCFEKFLSHFFPRNFYQKVGNPAYSHRNWHC